MYVPVPPAPVPSEAMYEPAGTPTPVMIWPTASGVPVIVTTVRTPVFARDADVIAPVTPLPLALPDSVPYSGSR